MTRGRGHEKMPLGSKKKSTGAQGERINPNKGKEVAYVSNPRGITPKSHGSESGMKVSTPESPKVGK